MRRLLLVGLIGTAACFEATAPEACVVRERAIVDAQGDTVAFVVTRECGVRVDSVEATREPPPPAGPRPTP